MEWLLAEEVIFFLAALTASGLLLIGTLKRIRPPVRRGRPSTRLLSAPEDRAPSPPQDRAPLRTDAPRPGAPRLGPDIRAAPQADLPGDRLSQPRHRGRARRRILAEDAHRSSRDPVEHAPANRAPAPRPGDAVAADGARARSADTPEDRRGGPPLGRHSPSPSSRRSWRRITGLWARSERVSRTSPGGDATPLFGSITSFVRTSHAAVSRRASPSRCMRRRPLPSTAHVLGVALESRARCAAGVMGVFEVRWCIVASAEKT